MAEENSSEIRTPEGLIASLTSSDAEFRHRVSVDIPFATISRFVIVGGVLWFVVRIWSVIILIVLSLMLVATFNPLVRKLQAKLGRSWAIAALSTSLVLVFLGLLGLVIPPLVVQTEHLIQNAPHYARQIQQTLALHHININIMKQAESLVGKGPDSSNRWLGILSNATTVVTGFVTVAILTIYLLIEGPEAGTNVMRLLPRKQRLPARKLFSEIGQQVGGYMRGQMITSGFAGLFSFGICLLMGVPNALALGAIAALADAIPLVGLLFALIPAAALAITVSVPTAGVIIAAYLIYHQIEDHFIAPRIYGTALGLSLSTIVISILIGVELMGILGALLALPVAAAIPSLVTFLQEWQEIRTSDDAEPQLP